MNQAITSPSEKVTYLIAGLGNPGREYASSRHNVGFLALNRLAVKLSLTFGRLQNKALVTKGVYHETTLILAKPQTYMNLSGQAVASLVKFYKIPIERLLVIYDEIDLPFGSLRMRPDGSSAGHKGMESIIDRLGSSDFARLRIGVGRPPGSKAAADYVLKDFNSSENEFLEELLERSADAALSFVSEGIDTAMNRFNTNGQI